LENVRGHLTMGALQVLGEITELGYNAEWRIVSAAGVGAPHRRDRLIIVAYPANQRQQGGENQSQPELNRRGNDEAQRGGITANNSRIQGTTDLANTAKQFSDGRGHEQHTGTFARGSGIQVEARGSGSNVANTNGEQLGQRGQQENVRQAHRIWEHNGTGQAGYDGWQWWETEPDVGRVVNGVPNRVDKLRGLGNAVVPQVAEYIGRLVMAAHNNS
jgi:DNA (cytosine-5)-methyltransferase 1